jgi:4-amino-4-deoxy-L-arabinose transferase-like glycosyltransferase
MIRQSKSIKPPKLENSIIATLVVFIISLIFLSWGISDYPLIDLDEPRYPDAAREMIENSQYWLPMKNGVFLFEKPILIYWSIILSFKTFGINEFAARLPSVIAGALTLTTAFIFGRFFKAGFYTCLILATSIEYFVIARLSIPEMLLNFFTITSLALYFLISKNYVYKNYFYLMSFLMAFGFMAKGPLAIFVPALVISVYSAIEHILKIQTIQEKIKLLLKNKVLVISSSIVFLLVGGFWYLQAHLITDGAFTQQFFLKENFNRYTSTLSGHKFSWWFYIAVMLVGFLPWSIFLPAYLLKLKENLKENFELKLFCLVWIFANIIFFSTSGTKLYNYIFSIFFPMATLLGLWFSEKRTSKDRKLLISSISFLIISLGISLFSLNNIFDNLIAKEEFLKDFIDPNLIYILTAMVIFASTLGIFLAYKKLSKAFFIVFALIFAVGQIYGVQNIIVPFAAFKVGGIKEFAKKIPKGTKVYRIRIDRPSLSYYYQGNTQRISLKKLKSKIINNEELCLLAKLDVLDRISKMPRLKILFKDQLYIYACTDEVIK